jgi:hypothetical protein
MVILYFLQRLNVFVRFIDSLTPCRFSLRIGKHFAKLIGTELF